MHTDTLTPRLCRTPDLILNRWLWDDLLWNYADFLDHADMGTLYLCFLYLFTMLKHEGTMGDHSSAFIWKSISCVHRLYPYKACGVCCTGPRGSLYPPRGSKRFFMLILQIHRSCQNLALSECVCVVSGDTKWSAWQCFFSLMFMVSSGVCVCVCVCSTLWFL